MEKFRANLISTEQIELINNHQTIPYDSKNAHGRLARTMGFSVEYKFAILCKSGTSGRTVDFLSRFSNYDNAGKLEKGEIALAVTGKRNEKIMVVVRIPLSDGILSSIDKEFHSGVGRGAKNFIVWDKTLFHRTFPGLKVVVSTNKRRWILALFHDRTGHWDITATRKYMTYRFWWLSVATAVSAFVKNCKACRRSKKIQNYHTSSQFSLALMFDTFSSTFQDSCQSNPTTTSIC